MLTLTLGSVAVLMIGATFTLFDTVDSFWIVLALMGIGCAWFVYAIGALCRLVAEAVTAWVQRHLSPDEPSPASGSDGPEDAPIGIRTLLGG